MPNQQVNSVFIYEGCVTEETSHFWVSLFPNGRRV
jgi:hypothetical protein